VYEKKRSILARFVKSPYVHDLAALLQKKDQEDLNSLAERDGILTGRK
jgi:hypothetical protein